MVTTRSIRGILADRCCPRSRGYLYTWEIIQGPPCLVGRVLRRIDIYNGGWCNGEIHARHIETGRIWIKKDTVEAVI
jgi:hypothetical protein